MVAATMHARARQLLLVSVATVACTRADADASVPPLAATAAAEHRPVEPAATGPAVAGPPSSPELDAASLPPRPAWTDRHLDESAPPPRFFNISGLMTAHGLTRDRAVELQNHFRDLVRAQPDAHPDAHFATALAKAREGTFEGRRDVERLAAAPFIVVFDLDDTLYDQSYSAERSASCFDLEVPREGGSKRIKLAPGAAAALDRVAALGGAVVLFTAAPDEPSHANLRAWSFGGAPLPEHPAIAGVLTNSHLVLQDKREGPGAVEPRRGYPVLEPSKDLRIVDEALERAILVDDNPLRTFQPGNVRVVRKFDADVYCATTDAKLRRAFERTLPDVVAEIEESLRWARGAKVSFVTAYLPYSQAGRVAVDFLRGAGMSERAAIAHIRTHPEVVDREF